MADMATLKYQKGRIKGSLTRLKTFVDNISEKTTSEDIEIRLEKMDDLLREFLECDDELALQAVDSEFPDFEEKFFDIKAALRRELNVHIKSDGLFKAQRDSDLNATMNQIKDQNQTMLASLKTNATTSSLVTNSDVVRLPKVNIPLFSGDYKDWPTFKDLFMSLIGNRTGISDAHKYQYLQGLVKGEGASLIKHLPVNDANYKEAWERLLSRYDKKRYILSSYIKAFLNQSNVTQNIVTALRSLCDTSDELIRGINALGDAVSGRDPWLIYIILSKTDPDTKGAWAEETVEKDAPTFIEFFNFLNRRCCALESVDSSSKRPGSKQTLRVLHSETSIECVCCSGSHQLFRCPTFKMLDHSSRAATIAKNSLCFNCLCSGHRVGQCRSKNTCRFCNLRHHSLLHGSDKPFQGIPLSSRHINPGNPSIGQLNPTSKPFNMNPNETIPPAITTSEVSVLALSHPTTRVSLLPTALVYVRDAYGTLQTCRALIDSGSQASFVTENCAQRLGYKGKNVKVIVYGLGSQRSCYNPFVAVLSGDMSGEERREESRCWFVTKNHFHHFNVTFIKLFIKTL